MTRIPPDDPPDRAKTREEHDAQLELEIRREYILAMHDCRAPERKFLKCLLECEGFPYRAGRKAQIGKASVWRMLRLKRVQRAMAAIKSILVVDLEVNAYTQQREYMRMARSKLNDAYFPKGHEKEGQMIPPHEWSDELAAAVQEFSYDKSGLPQIKMHPKGPALDALTRLRNMGPPQRLELTGKDGESLNAVPAVMVVPGLVPEKAWADAAAEQQRLLAESENRFVEPSRVIPT